MAVPAFRVHGITASTCSSTLCTPVLKQRRQHRRMTSRPAASSSPAAESGEPLATSLVPRQLGGAKLLSYRSASKHYTLPTIHLHCSSSDEH